MACWNGLEHGKLQRWFWWREHEFSERASQNGTKALSIGQLLRSRFQRCQKAGRISQNCLYRRLLGMRAGNCQSSLSAMAGLRGDAMQQQGPTGNGFEVLLGLRQAYK